MISEEQEDFLQCILSIPLEERGWKKLVTLDSLHTFSGGPILMNEARWLDTQSRLRKFLPLFPSLTFYVFSFPQFCNMYIDSKMDLGKRSSLEVKKAIAACAKVEGLSTLSVQVGQKRKGRGDGEYPYKKASNPPVCLDQVGPSQKTFEPPCHGVGKGLMTSQGPISPVLVALVVRDKWYAMETALSIIKDVEFDQCFKHETKSLGDFGLFDLTRVSFYLGFLSLLWIQILNIHLPLPCSSPYEDASPLSQMRCSRGGGQASSVQYGL